MFQLTNQQTKINSFVPRMEKHGDENVLAGTMKCETTMHSSVLDIFDKGLRKLLYRKPSAGEQSELPLGDSDGRTSGKLCQLIQDTVEVTLTPPSKDDAQQDMEKTA